MKRLIFLLVFLLTCCAPKPTPTPTPPAVDLSLVSHSLPTGDLSMYTPAVAAFTVGAACPHMCWLGINPGTTTAADALAALKASDQIDQKSLQATDTGIVLKWYTEKSKQLVSSVYLLLENSLVKSISFDGFAPFKLKDLAGLLGNPYGVNMDMEVNDGVLYLPYETYYPSQIILIGSDAAKDGPNADDGLVSLSLNIKYDNQIFRPWLGYGHMKEYTVGKQVDQHNSPKP